MAWLQANFYVLTGLFDRVGLQNNTKNRWDDVSTLPHCWRKLGGGVYAAYDGHGTILLGSSAGESLVNLAQDGFDSGVADIP